MIDEDRHPEIGFYLRFHPFSPFELELDGQGEWSAKRGDEYLHTGSVKKEMETVFTSVNFASLQVLYIYGIGLGAYYLTILSWLKISSAHRLVILEDDLGAVDACCKLPMGLQMLQNPQVILKYVTQSQEWSYCLEECASQFPYSNIEVVCLPHYLKKKGARFRSLKLKLQRLSIVWNAACSEGAYAAFLTQNVLRNLKRLPEAFFVNKWKGKFKGVPAVICGAGPSLSSFKEDLLKWQDKALLIAGGSALSALGHLKIQPHLGVIVDPNEEEYTAIKNCPYRNIPLLFCSRVNPEALNHFVGPWGYIRSSTGGQVEKWIEKQLDIDSKSIGPDMGRESFSVTTLAIPLAQILGCDPIILVGVDLSYAKDQKYSKGVASFISSTEPIQRIQRLNNGKEVVQTHLKWVMEADVIGKYALKKRKNRFFRAGFTGLVIRHVEPKHAEGISTHLKPQGIDISQKIKRAIQESRFSFSSKQLKRVYGRLLKRIEEALCYVEEIIQTGDGGKKIVAELDLKESDIYPLLIQPISRGFIALMKPHFFHDLQNPTLEEKEALEEAKWKHVKEALNLVKSELVA